MVPGSKPFALLLTIAVAMLVASARGFLIPAARPPSATAAAGRPRTTALAPLAVASTPVPPTAGVGAAGTGPAGAAAAAARRPRKSVDVLSVIESPGGYMAKVQVQNFNEQSSHTVIVAKDLFAETCALAGKEDANVEDYFKAVFKFIMQKGMPLQNTEGMLTAEMFPSNYFTVAQLSIYLDGVTEGVADVLKEM